MQTVRAADTNEVVKLIFRESDNDRKVSTEGAACALGRGPCSDPHPTRGPALGRGPCSDPHPLRGPALGRGPLL